MGRGLIIWKQSVPRSLKKAPTPRVYCRALGMVQLWGPSGRRFIMSQVPL